MFICKVNTFKKALCRQVNPRPVKKVEKKLKLRFYLFFFQLPCHDLLQHYSTTFLIPETGDRLAFAKAIPVFPSFYMVVGTMMKFYEKILLVIISLDEKSSWFYPTSFFLFLSPPANIKSKNEIFPSPFSHTVMFFLYFFT